MVTFYEIQKRVCGKFSYVIADMTDEEDLAILDLIKNYINQAQEIIYRMKMSWMKKEGKVVLKASYSTGTIIATANSATITGSGTTFTRDMEGQKIIITDDTDGSVVYRLKSYVSGTEFTLDCNYIHTGGAGLSYAIYYDTYTLPEDFKTIEVMKDIDLLTTYYNDDNYLLSSSYTSSLPTEMKFLGLSDTAYYETGTVAITANAVAVVGTDTAFDSTMIGRYILIGTYGKLYEITAVADTAHLTIGKGYGGDTETAAKFKIDPPGLQEVRFHSAPSVAKIIPYTYYPKAIRLQDDEDLSPIPSESILTLGAIWLWYKNEDDPAQENAKRDFDQAVMQIALIKIDSNQESMPPVFN